MPEDKKIILFEQDHARKDSLKTLLSKEGYLVFSFDAIASCLDNIGVLDADLMILGGMEEGKAIPILNALMAIQIRLPLLFISRDENLRHYLDTHQCDYAAIVNTPFDWITFRTAVQTALANNDKPGKMDFISFLVGNSPELFEIKGKLTELGRLNESIMIAGEPGVGKESVARAIHRTSNQDTSSFIKIDVSELNAGNGFSLLTALGLRVPDLVTGQKKQSDTKSERWTIYLDEIGALPDHLQAELLLITGTDNNHFRILAGTSQNMEMLVKTGCFRKDLFYRLNVFQVKVPPLRRRKPDIPLLTDFFTYKFCREFDKVCLPVSNRLKSMFMQYHWPGNVGELQDVVKRALLKGEQNIIFSNLWQKSRKDKGQVKKSQSKNDRIQNIWSRELDSIEQMTRKKEYLGQVGELDMRDICLNFMAKVETKIMKRALETTHWNRKKAAAMLDISYKSMLNKIKHYGLA